MPFFLALKLGPAFARFLFMATPENIQELSNRFHSIMNLFVDDSIQDIVNLSAWKCRRIDYTANLQFKDDEEIVKTNLKSLQTSCRSLTRTL